MDLYLHTFGLRYNYQYKHGFDVYKFLDLAAAHGFCGVNISVYRPNYRFLSGSDPQNLARVRAYAERLGLGIDVESNGTEPSSMEELLDFAVALGAGAARTYTTPTGRQQWEDWPRGQDSVAERSARAVQDLAAAAKLAEQRSVPIVLENHEELTGSENGHILAAVDSPWVGALFDYGNSMVNGEEPIVALEAMGPWVRTAHLKDQVFVPPADAKSNGELVGVPVGHGTLPVREITERLVALGVGRVCVENCWGYSTPVDDWRGGGHPGTGAFVERMSASRSTTPGRLVPDARLIPKEELPRVELEMLETTIDGLRECLAGLGGISPGLAGSSA